MRGSRCSTIDRSRLLIARHERLAIAPLAAPLVAEGASPRAAGEAFGSEKQNSDSATCRHAEDRVSNIGPRKRSAPFSLRSQRRQFDARTVAFPALEWESRQNTKPLGVYAMSKFLIEASLTTVGVKGVQSEGGTARREAVTKAVESVGGRLDSFFFGFGDRDVYVIADFPDNESAAAMAIAVNSSGAVATRTVVLLTPEEVDRAVKRSVEYRAPGA